MRYSHPIAALALMSLLFTPGVGGLTVWVEPTAPADPFVAEGMETAADTVQLLATTPYVLPGDTSKGVHGGIILNWQWKITIQVPVLPVVPTAFDTLDQLAAWIDDLPTASACEQAMQASWGLLATGLREAQAVANATGQKPLINVLNNTPPVQVEYECQDSEIEEVEVEVTTPARDLAGGAPVNVNGPDFGAIALDLECESTKHGNGWNKKATYTHVRTGSGKIATNLFQAYIASDYLYGTGSGTCKAHEHDTDVSGPATGTIFAAVPVKGTMKCSTNGGTVDLGPIGGGRVEFMSFCEVNMSFLPVLPNVVRIWGEGWDLGA